MLKITISQKDIESTVKIKSYGVTSCRHADTQEN